MFSTPILLMVFNRPEKTRSLLTKLSTIKPSKIYIGADGPRSVGESEKTLLVRKIIEQDITWDCTIKKLYRDNNLGCRKACSESISWFLKHEEEGIILEDDIEPSIEFFRFCEELLGFYRDTESVMHISGYQSHLDDSTSESYFLSRFPRVWGWATWRRAWKSYNDDPGYWHDWLKSPSFRKDIPNSYYRAFWQLIIEKMNLPKSKLRNSSWAYPWALSVARSQGVCVSPNLSTVRNIGFDQEATHTKSAISTQSNGRKLEFPLAHPPTMKIDMAKDWQFFRYQLVDTNIKFLKVVLKTLFPFLKPFS